MLGAKYRFFFVAVAMYGIFFPAKAGDEVKVLEEDRSIELMIKKEGGARKNIRDGATENLREYGFWGRTTRFGPKGTGVGDAIYNSTIYAWYETVSMKHIEDYGFVRYLRGCAFSSSLGENGGLEQSLNVTRRHYGKRTVFVHPDWEIDSEEGLPMFGASRLTPLLPHYFMEWGVPPNKFPEKSYKRYGEDPPAEPRLYAKESILPAAYVTGEGKHAEALNHSFEFKVCLYPTKKIAQSVDKQQFIEDPIDCFTWSSSFVYDHQANTFTSPSGIQPICRPETIPSPEEKPREFK